MRGGGEGGFEGLEIKGIKIDDFCQRSNTGTKETVSVLLDRWRARKLGMGKGGGGGWQIYGMQ